MDWNLGTRSWPDASTSCAHGPLFDKITATGDGFRVLAAPGGPSAQAGLTYARIAVERRDHTGFGMPHAVAGNPSSVAEVTVSVGRRTVEPSPRADRYPATIRGLLGGVELLRLFDSRVLSDVAERRRYRSAPP